jgi:hypothetical protein
MQYESISSNPDIIVAIKEYINNYSFIIKSSIKNWN